MSLRSFNEELKSASHSIALGESFLRAAVKTENVDPEIKIGLLQHAEKNAARADAYIRAAELALIRKDWK